MDFFNSKPPTGASATSAYDTPETPFGRAINERFTSNATSSLLTTRLSPSVPLQTPIAPAIGQLHRTALKPPPLATIPAGSISGASALSLANLKRSGTPAVTSLAFTALLPAEVIPLLSMENVLFIDLRSYTNYQASHLRNSISLAIPSTLLKRPNFALDQMSTMINNKLSREHFDKWRTADTIVAYDVDSFQLMENTTLCGLLRKFLAAGFKGTLAWIKGGFNVLSTQFPSVLETVPSAIDVDDTSEEDGDTILRTRNLSMHAFQQSSTTIVGQRTPKGNEHTQESGSAQLAANPFYDNIRQNIELSQGADNRISLKLPPHVLARRNELPFKWLRDIMDQTQVDEVGESLAMQFYRIELGEQRRLQGVMDHHSREGGKGGKNDTDFPYSIIAGIEMGTKNRYRNIWPFEHARVRLQRQNSRDGSDYVNASYVQSLVSSRRYIATQGPLDSTYDDFWSICWEQNVPVIVMLTREVESSLVKCGKYWTDGQYGDITIKLLKQEGQDEADKSKAGIFFQTNRKVDSADTIIERILQLKNRAQPNAQARRIVHLQYLGWPDQDVPTSPEGLLKLIKRVNLVTNGHPTSGSPGPGPVLLHCSAGVGRTGGFILVDSVLAGIRHEMERKGTFPAQPIVDDTSESDEMEVDVSESVFSRRTGLRSGSNNSFSPTSSLFGGPSQSGSDGAPIPNTSNSSLSSTNASPSVRPRSMFEGTPFGSETSRPIAPKSRRLSHVIAEKLIKDSRVALHTPAEITEWSLTLPPGGLVPGGAQNPGAEPFPTRLTPPEEKSANYKLPRKLDVRKGSPPFPSSFTEPVRQVLEDMREQRMSLCQSLRQYVFAHRAIIEGTLELVDEAKAQRAASQPPAQSSTHRNTVGEEMSTNSGTSAGGFMPWSSTSSLSSASGLAPSAASLQTSTRAKAGRLISNEDKTPRGSSITSSPPPPPRAAIGKRSASPPTKLSGGDGRIGKSFSLKKKHRSDNPHAEELTRTVSLGDSRQPGHSGHTSHNPPNLLNRKRP